MSIKQWPKMERPRERLLYQGAEYLSDAELLAIFIRTGVKGKTALDLSRELISTFGSLNNLVNSSFSEFSQLSGMGTAKYCQIKASIELAKRCLLKTDEPTSSPLTSSQSARDYLQLQMGHYAREVFGVVLLNSQHDILCFEELFFGSATEAPVYINPLVKTCIDKNAQAIILAHNHPSNRSMPSQSDIKITHAIQKALAIFDVKVLDHFIVTRDKVESLAELGHLCLT